MKRVVFIYCRSTKLLRLFPGNLLAVFQFVHFLDFVMTMCVHAPSQKATFWCLCQSAAKSMCATSLLQHFVWVFCLLCHNFVSLLYDSLNRIPFLIARFNCSRTMFETITLNVYVFLMQNFVAPFSSFEFSSRVTFHA